MPTIRRTEPIVVTLLAVASVAAAVFLPSAAAAEARGSLPIVRALALAIPVVWAVLLLYVPVRLVGWWMWQEVERAAPRRDDRRLLLIVLVLGFGLMAWGLEWGLAGDAWAPDELRPETIRDGLEQGFANGWHDKYPAMHFIVLGIPALAFRLASRFPSLGADPLPTYAAQFAMMRLVSLFMGLGALTAIYLCAVELYGVRRAALAPLALLLTPLFLYYGKTANLDVPTLCWFGWAVLAFLRVLRAGRREDYVLLGVAAAASVATKDQAYASLAILPLAVLWATARRQAAHDWWRRLLAALTDTRLLAGVAATVGASFVLHNMLLNFSGFIAHVSLLSTLNDIAIVPRTLAGAGELTWRTIDLFRMSLGWPLFILALFGVASAIVHPGRRWCLALLLVPLSFHLTFTWVTFFVCDRYLFGGVFVLALFAGAGMNDVLDTGRWRRTAWSAVGMSLGYSLLYASSINVMMNVDARHATLEWLRVQVPEDAAVGLVGRYMPYLAPPFRVHAVETRADLAANTPDVILVNNRYAQRFRLARSAAGRELMQGLTSGALGYVEVFRYRAPVPFWALLQYEAPFQGMSESWWTNLDKVNPEMVIFQRR